MRHDALGTRCPLLARLGWALLLLIGGFTVFALPATAEVTPTTCPGVNCTAEDLQILSLEASAHFSDPTCDSVNDTFNVEITHVLATQGGNTRLDIGLYTTSNPGEALDCSVDILEGPQATGFTNIDGDDCGDLDGDDEVTHTQIYTVPCTDVLPPLGSVDPIVIWQSWVQPGGDIANCDETNVIEGTTAKCRTTVSPKPGVPVPVCGDETVDAGEECDDGNQTNGDGCSSSCIIEFCGDGTLQPELGDPVEQCDDGNNTNEDGCSSTCQLESCGDGEVQAPEECDDGNNDPNDGCSPICLVERCGDGIQQAGEECDDSNTQNEDGCNSSCQDEFCGDEVIQEGLGESCDDGNNVGGDGCSETCQIETPTTGEWGMVLLTLLLLGTGAATLRRRTEPTA